MTIWQRLRSVNLSVRVIVGALLGILCGAFFGEYAAALQPVGAIYVMLLQMVVFPFLVSALLHGLGSLTPKTALRLLKSGAPLFLLAWVVVFVTLFVFAQAIPAAQPPIVVKAGGGQSLTDLVSLLIPANPFTDLTRNYVPAIVVFCAFFGVAIERVEKKQSLLEALDAFRRASITIWGWVVGIAPFGVFALAASVKATVHRDVKSGAARQGTAPSVTGRTWRESKKAVRCASHTGRALFPSATTTRRATSSATTLPLSMRWRAIWA